MNSNSNNPFEKGLPQDEVETKRNKNNSLLLVLLLIAFVVLGSCFFLFWSNENTVDKPTVVTEKTIPVAKPNSSTEKEEEVTEKTPKSVDSTTIKLYTDKASMEEAKHLWDNNCVPCHRSDGGGSIGPNLTDEYWILGGGFDNIYNTISEGGRRGKGMVPWKDNFTPKEIALVASYIISLNGTTPEDPKNPEGDIIWHNDME